MSPTNDVKTSKELSRLEKTLNTRLIVDLAEFCQRTEIPSQLASELIEANRSFPFRFPESALSRITKGDINDPILRQFLPSLSELEEHEGFSFDPLCEHASILKTDNNGLETNSGNPPSCLLQKYSGRVLVITSNECAARCRFCFRRHFPVEQALFPLPKSYVEGASENLDAYLNDVFSPFKDDPTIHEIIFSGGDPLTLPNESLKKLLHCIKSWGNVKRVRFHSRIPILVPCRIDRDFPGANEFSTNDVDHRLILHMTLHVNSPNEIDRSVAQAIRELRTRGFVLTSQTVLLRGVNDSPDVLVELFEKLADLGVIPYYLHQLDKVQGAAHFETSVEHGLTLIKEISARLPGYATPKYVQEIPGKPMKTSLLASSDPEFWK